MTSKKPDSEFKYRVVSGDRGRRITWHTLECKTGKNAKRSGRTSRTYEPYLEHGLKQHHLAKCCLGQKDAQKTTSRSFTTRQAKALFAMALKAGLDAGQAATPTPMVVGTPTTLLGNELDYSKKTYEVPEGPCGFAWVNIRPGNSSIARQAVKLGIGAKSYEGGIDIWVHDHGQSLDRKSQHAKAYTAVLREHGVNASSRSRLD